MIKISPHFSFEELCFTSFHSFAVQNRQEALLQKTKLTALAYYLLEPIRTLLGAPLKVSSAYRCGALNKYIGGSPSSQHLKGEAADFIPAGTDLKEAFELIKSCRNIHFGQLILEPGWIHISLGAGFRELSKCGQVFVK